MEIFEVSFDEFHLFLGRFQANHPQFKNQELFEASYLTYDVVGNAHSKQGRRRIGI